MAFQILSISGGGYLGLYSISVLEELEKAARKPIAQCFDLLAGTSIGGIIALGLAAEIPAKDIKAAFKESGIKIFGPLGPSQNVLTAFISLLCSLPISKYSQRNLKQTIMSLMGAETLIGDLKHPVMVPTVNLSKGSPQIFKTPHHSDFKTDLHLPVVDVALATSAAPTYFPVAKVGNALFADGGLYANSPDILALHEAEHFFKINKSDIRLLSIGTTTSKFSFTYTARKRMGTFRWMKGQRLVNVLISSQQMSVDYMVRHKLANNYLRLDTPQSKEQAKDLGLDVATDKAQQTIMSMAQATVQDNINNALLQTMLKNIAPEPVFYNMESFRK